MNDMTAIVPAAPLGELAKALAAAQAEMKPAAKDSENPHFKSKYADLEAINEAARVLSNHGIAVLCVPSGWTENRIIVRGMLVHSSGQSIEGVLEMPVSQPNNPQAVGSALSYSRRYLISSLANIAAGDDDGNAAAEKSDGTPEPKKAQPRTEPEKSAQQTAAKSSDKAAEGPASRPGQSAAERYTDKLIDDMQQAKSLADASRVLMEQGLADIDDGNWTIEENTKLAKLKNTAPDQYKRVQDAYTAYQNKDIAA